jgi:GNAT superfamily N-acetyltransferase
MVTAPAALARETRALAPADLERVIAIDRTSSGAARRRFFEKRFAAAKTRPDDFVHIGIHGGGVLRGFASARILRGEFGRDDAVAVLDAIGVAPTSQNRGVGQALMQELTEMLRRAGVRSLQSQADWTSHRLLQFIDGSGLAQAPRLALERPVVEPLEEASEQI